MAIRGNRRRAGTASEVLPNRFQHEPNTVSKVQLPATSTSLPSLRFAVQEAALILRMSRAQLYNRMKEGRIKGQKDGARTYITRVELERYVAGCSPDASE